MFVLIDVPTRLPLAVQVVKIQEDEGRWLVPWFEQAQEHLGRRGHINTSVIERGYLDGEELGRVHQLGVIFVVVSKSNMEVRQDAQAEASRERERGGVREGGVRHAEGKTAREERWRTDLGGIEG